MVNEPLPTSNQVNTPATLLICVKKIPADDIVGNNNNYNNGNNESYRKRRKAVPPGE